MKNTPRSDAEAIRVSTRTPLEEDWYDAIINTATEKMSKWGRPTIELSLLVMDGAGKERTLPDWVDDSEKNAAKLRHICEAVGAMDHYDSGELDQGDFPGHKVQVKIVIHKRRGFPDQNRVDDYRPAAETRVVNLRTG